MLFIIATFVLQHRSMLSLDHVFIEKKNDEQSENILTYAKSHLNKPYIKNSLDRDKTERLIVRFDGFDCSTFVETVLAQTKDSSNVYNFVKKVRYRNGKIDGYASRIHYFSDWIYENTCNGLFVDYTAELPYAKDFNFKVNYMTRHLYKYPMITNDSIFNEIKAMEEKVSSYTLKYIPKSKVEQIKNYVKDGDIIGITTNKKGLDLSHVGFAVWQENELHLLHASSEFGKVMITKNPMSTYLNKNYTQTGIVLLRML